MACRNLGKEPLSKQVLTYCQLDIKNTIQWNFKSKAFVNIYEVQLEMIFVKLSQYCFVLINKCHSSNM